MRVRVAACLAAVALCGFAPDAASQVYPAKPITLVVPFARDGAADIVGRLLAERLTAILQQQVSVENRAGRGGTVATEGVAKAEPDGHTLLFVTSATLVTAPIFLRLPGYDPLGSFAPITLVSFMKSLIAVNPSLAANNLDELIALLKANPGRHRYAHSGVGGHSYLTGELFKSQTGVDIRDVGARGIGAAIDTVLRGNADMVFELPVSLAPHIREGRLRPIAVMGLGREPVFPGVPTVVEQGMPELLAYSWTGVVAPRGTPRAVIEVLNRAIHEVLSEIESQATFQRYGLQIETGTPEEFHRLIQAELTRWSRALPLSATSPR